MTPPRPPRLLVIDDDRAMCEMLTALASTFGYETTTASTLAEIRTHIDDRHDLILLDLSLGETDGMTVMRALAERHAAANLVLLTGADQSVLSGARRVAELSGFNVVGACPKSATITQLRAILEDRRDVLDETPAFGLRSSGEPIDERVQMAEAAVRALDAGRAYLLYQPILDARTNLVVGAEALVRLDVPEFEHVSPEIFVPAIEAAGRSGQLLDAVLALAARDRANVPALKALPTVSINVSVLDLADLSLPDRAEHILTAGAQPSRWVLEITETAEVDRLADALDVLIRLRLKGFGLAMDDFGSGTSTLARLREYPFTVLKADRRFADADQHDIERTRNMFRAAVDLAAALGLKVVAEGIETADEMTMCREVGCDLVQGYFIGRPVRPEAFGVLVASWNVSLG